MYKVLTYVAGLLLLAIIFFTYRALKLFLSRKTKGGHLGNISSNKVNAYLMLFFLVVFMVLFWGYSFYVKDEWLTSQAASDQGERVDQLFWTTTTIILIPFTLLHILLFWTAFKFRKKENKKARFYPANLKLEISWTVVTAVTLIVLIILGNILWSDLHSSPPKDAEIVDILGAQFVWFFRYPGKDGRLGETDYRLIDAENNFGINFTDKASLDDFTTPVVHIPKGRPVLFIINARDVIHSVFAPHFRLKMDAVPGMRTQFWFTPKYTTEEMREMKNDQSFNYEIACAELCGRGHFMMRAIIVVDEPDDYDRWFNQQQPWLAKHPDYQPDHVSTPEVTEKTATTNY